MVTFFSRSAWLSFALLTGLVLLASSGPVAHSRATVLAAPWTVFTPADSSLPMDANALSNADFESGLPGSADGWSDYGLGYAVDETGGRGGGRALQLVNAVSSETHGAYQVITLNQTEPRALYFSGWSKAVDITGTANSDYSLYLDVYYTDGTPLWGQVLTFDTGTHDWQFRDGFVVPAKPIERVHVHCLLRSSHSGAAWFDDLSVKEVQAEIVTFDSVQVATHAPATPPFGGATLALATADGLTLSLAADGGAVTGVTLEGAAVQDDGRAYAGGFFVRDVVAESDYVHVGGSLAQNGDVITHSSTITALDLDFGATYSAVLGDRIEIHAAITDTRTISDGERALTLYFALPISATGWTWGDDIRTSRAVSGVDELVNLHGYAGVGATGYVSKYPWASLSGLDGGIAVSVPLDSPRVMRLVHNPTTNQFYAAFDLGLSAETKFPGRAWVDLVLYRFDGEWRFRAAAEGYYARFPDAFVRRIPPEQEGIWVAFSDLAPIPEAEDFGIAFHELGSLDQVPFDETHGILSFRYVSEPWSHWLPIDDPGVDAEDYDQVMAFLESLYAQGDPRAEATLSSGFFDESGRYRYKSMVAPWCSGVAGCAVFTVNPDPDVSDPTYALNKAHLDWNAAAREAYTGTPGLDGEYVDSFLSHAFEMDFRTAHYAAADIPLTFQTSDRRVGVPEVLASTEFARWMAQDVHENLGKWMMANTILLDLPWGADVFDVMGTETDWLQGSALVPDSDASLSYRRTLAYQRPYGLLMNTDFDNLSHELVERYFQVCLFYGIYPSLFSQNAATERYWDDPALYEHDRALFQRYIPLIRRLNVAGWEPVTHAAPFDVAHGETFDVAHGKTFDVAHGKTSEPGVYVERFGDWPDLYFTLRNTSGVSVTVGMTLEADALGLPGMPLSVTAMLEGSTYTLGAPGPTRSLSVGLAADASEVLYIGGGVVYLPAVVK